MITDEDPLRELLYYTHTLHVLQEGNVVNTLKRAAYHEVGNPRQQRAVLAVEFRHPVVIRALHAEETPVVTVSCRVSPWLGEKQEGRVSSKRMVVGQVTSRVHSPTTPWANTRCRSCLPLVAYACGAFLEAIGNVSAT